MATWGLDPDVRSAATLDAAFYRSDHVFAESLERVFARSWQWIGRLDDVAAPGHVSPRWLLPGGLDEPVLLSRDQAGTLRCLSNVCTHRGNLLVHEACAAGQIRCGYHARRFDLSSGSPDLIVQIDVESLLSLRAAYRFLGLSYGFPGNFDILRSVREGHLRLDCGVVVRNGGIECQTILVERRCRDRALGDQPGVPVEILLGFIHR